MGKAVRRGRLHEVEDRLLDVLGCLQDGPSGPGGPHDAKYRYRSAIVSADKLAIAIGEAKIGFGDGYSKFSGVLDEIERLIGGRADWPNSLKVADLIRLLILYSSVEDKIHGEQDTRGPGCCGAAHVNLVWADEMDFGDEPGWAIRFWGAIAALTPSTIAVNFCPFCGTRLMAEDAETKEDE